MKTVISPYLSVFNKSSNSISRLQVVRTLLSLAVKKRIASSQNVVARLGDINLFSPDYDTLSFLIKEKFIDEEYHFASGQPRPLIIDCGAHIGISMVYFKTLYPSSVIHCFEPSGNMYQFLLNNVSGNNFADVHLYNKAVYTSDGSATLYLPDTGMNINYSLLSKNKNDSFEKVHSIRLSDFLRNFSRIDLLKLDIEGAEPEVIRDLHEQGMLSSGSISNIIVEFHQSMFNTQEKLDTTLSIFKQHNYRLQVKKHYGDYLIRAEMTR